MKKIILLIGLFFLTTGCGFDFLKEEEELIKETVSSYITEYQDLSITVMIPLSFDMEEIDFFSESSETYYELAMKKQYQDITYKITSVSLYSESATAKVEIYTYDFISTKEAAEEYMENDGAYLLEGEEESIQKLLFENYLYQKMYEEETRIKQEIILNLSKEDGSWKVNSIDEDTLLKIRGLFE